MATISSDTADGHVRLTAFCLQCVGIAIGVAGFPWILAIVNSGSAWMPSAVTAFSYPATVLLPASVIARMPSFIPAVCVAESLALCFAAMCLRTGTHQKFVTAIACAVTAFFPLGTVLGGITLWTLLGRRNSG